MKPFHVLVKPVGASCNLSCSYCYYLEKRALYPHGPAKISKNVLEAYMTQLIDSTDPGATATISWQGGEPTLMGLEFFREATAMARRIAGPNRRIAQTIQTNGMLLDDEWGEFLLENDFLVGISVDGPESVHDSGRRDRGGKPSFSRTMRGVEILGSWDVSFNILCSVGSGNADRPREIYRFLRDACDARFLQFIPLVLAQQDGAILPDSVTPWSWGHFLTEVFDEWFRNDVGSVFVQIFESTLASWMDLPSPMCIFSDDCGRSLALERNGDLYSCDHFVDPGHLLGNILVTDLESLIDSDEQRRFGRNKNSALGSKCRECQVLFACRGECPKNRVPTAEGGMASYLCEGYYQYFLAVDGPMSMLAQLLSSGRSAAELYGLLAKMDPASMCPCGSGMKLGDCHSPSPHVGERDSAQ